MASIFLPTTETREHSSSGTGHVASNPDWGELDWSTHGSPRDHPSPLHLAPPSDSLRRHRTWMRSSFWVPDRVTFADSLGRGAKGVRVWKRRPQRLQWAFGHQIKTSLRNVNGPRNGIIVMYSGLPRPDKAVEVLRAKCISLVMAMASTFRGGSEALFNLNQVPATAIVLKTSKISQNHSTGQIQVINGQWAKDSDSRDCRETTVLYCPQRVDFTSWFSIYFLDRTSKQIELYISDEISITWKETGLPVAYAFECQIRFAGFWVFRTTILAQFRPHTSCAEEVVFWPISASRDKGNKRPFLGQILPPHDGTYRVKLGHEIDRGTKLDVRSCFDPNLVPQLELADLLHPPSFPVAKCDQVVTQVGAKLGSKSGSKLGSKI
ncbi:hypothetical protein B0H10DRAFT_1968099 [Mycena sp. CBHHK59/15]|nr:hypothetical protein B0H10DRAFT_1968099 [Mycena sp. CBHHK59/15]